jgi:hypothetical protein
MREHKLNEQNQGEQKQNHLKEKREMERKMEMEEEVINESPPDGLRLFPLMAENKNSGELKSVNPLKPVQKAVPPQGGNKMNRFQTTPQAMRPHTQQQPQQHTPERAAEQFRRVNKSLPDGVRYEPLDEETVRLLRDNGHLPEQPQSQPVQQMQSQPVQQTQSQPVQQTPPPQPMQIVDTRTPMIPQPQVPSFASASTTASTIEASPIFPSLSPPPSLPPPPPLPPLAPEIAGILEELAQDERNAQVFYGHFSRNAPKPEVKEALAGISKECGVRLRLYAGLLVQHFNRQFFPEETEINIGITFVDAISLALLEENKSLVVLAELLDKVNNTVAEKDIQRILSKKIINNQLLLAINK